jgi:hypothetical protein
MSRRSLTSRLALWAAICALALKAAVPLFAVAAAQAQGVAVAELCSVYGVALPVSSATAQAHAHHHGGHAGHDDHGPHSPAHAGDHCALTALATMAVPDVAPLRAPSPAASICKHATTSASATIRDACAAWAARLEHGPPSLA